MFCKVIEKLNLQDNDTVEKVLILQKASYEVEAKIIEFADIPPLKDTIDTLRGCTEVFFGYFIDKSLAGIISFKIEDDVLDIHRVAVHPDFFRRGIAEELLHLVMNLEDKFDKIVVSTGRDNLPAVNLYCKLGFKKIEDINIVDNLFISTFEYT